MANALMVSRYLDEREGRRGRGDNEEMGGEEESVTEEEIKQTI